TAGAGTSLPSPGTPTAGHRAPGGVAVGNRHAPPPAPRHPVPRSWWRQQRWSYSGLRSGGEVLVVAFRFQLSSEFRTALFGDAAIDEDVNELRLDVLQYPGVVGDENDAGAGVGLGAVDALTHDAQGVDIQPGVSFVEDGEARLEQLHLQ